jgi:predicted SAM-dependent methyltransferase
MSPDQMNLSIRLNLGCGSIILPDYVNVDIAPVPGADVVHDLDVRPWPWEADTVEQIVAKDVFEHVESAVIFMAECHRVLVPGGLLHLRTPHYKSRDAFTDPTHRRFPTEHTFDYWIQGTVLHGLHNAAYGGVSFRLAGYRLELGSMDFVLEKLEVAP